MFKSAARVTKTMSLHPPISWVGGKFKSRNLIISVLPEHEVYVEPFCGGASVYWGKEPVRLEVLADVNRSLMNFYVCLQNKPIEWWEQLNYKPNRKIFDLAKANEKDARGFYYLNKWSFGSKHGNYALTNRKNTFKLFLDRIPEYKERLENTRLYFGDFEKVSRKYDSPKTLFYFDPPYTMSGQGDYFETGYDEGIPQRLARLCRSMRGKFALSYDNVPLVHDLFRGFKFFGVRNDYCMNRLAEAKKHTELLITNFPVKDV